MRCTPFFTAPYFTASYSAAPITILLAFCSTGMLAATAQGQDWLAYAHAPRTQMAGTFVSQRVDAQPVHYTLADDRSALHKEVYQNAQSYGPTLSESCAGNCGAGCGDACCADACCCDPCCGPLTVRAGAVYVHRSNVDNIPLVTQNLGAGPVAISGGDYDFGYSPGVDASVIYDGGRTPWSVETRFLWIDDWTTSQNAVGLNNAGITTTPTTNLFGGMVETNYRSELESLEINLRRSFCCGTFTLLSGMRYITFNERLDINFDNFSENRFATGNELLGYQLGGEGILYDNCCGFRVEGFGKAGIYGNNARTMVMLQQIEQEPASESAGMDHVAFFGELGLFASYEFCPCWRVRAGYQAMWLDGVLVAANQVPQTDNAGMTVGFDYTDAFFHGALLSLEANW